MNAALTSPEKFLHRALQYALANNPMARVVMALSTSETPFVYQCAPTPRQHIHLLYKKAGTGWIVVGTTDEIVFVSHHTATGVETTTKTPLPTASKYDA